MNKVKLYLIILNLFMVNAMAGTIDAFMDACEKGDMQACYQAGVLYQMDKDVSKDKNVAKSLFQISCDGGISDACMALRTLGGGGQTAGYAKTKVQSSRYAGRIDGKLQGDLDHDGKIESVVWRKTASTDSGDYYQLLLIDDDGSLVWKGPGSTDDEDPLVFYFLDFGESLPQVLTDFDLDGSLELLAPVAQSDVSPTYYRKLRWRDGYFEPLLQNALMLSPSDSNRFVWKTTPASYGTWISRLAPYGNSLVKASVTEYNKDESIRMGVALIRFVRGGAAVSRWLEPMASSHSSDIQNEAPTVNKQENIGLVYGLDPWGDGFLAIRERPNSTQIGSLYNGDRVEILGRSGKWYKIRDLKSGKVGWSHSNWIRTD